MSPVANPRDYLRRLPAENYRGHAYVHWALTIEKRKTGWLGPLFHSRFREIQSHTAFRFGLCCPIYCLMPDHIHLMWLGYLDTCDQRNAMRFFRSQLNIVLSKVADEPEFELQLQPYDHVLGEKETERSAFEDVCEYIARNPERAQLVADDQWQNYPFTGCLVPGYPDLEPFQDGYWELFWRLYSRIKDRS